MNSKSLYESTKDEFEEEWANNEIEELLKQNKYPRAIEEYSAYAKYLNKNEMILEAGCGLGPKLLHLKSNGHRVIGVDYVRSALRRLKKYDSNVNIVNSDIHDCAFKDSTFGAYLSYGVLEHFPEGPHEALKEAHRILKKDGTIVVLIPANNGLSRFVFNDNNLIKQIKAHKRVRKIFGKPALPEVREENFYMKLFKREEMRSILENQGFEIMFEKPVSHSYSLWLLCECFQGDTKGRTNLLAETIGSLFKKFLPWSTANHYLFVGRKL